MSAWEFHVGQRVCCIFDQGKIDAFSALHPGAVFPSGRGVYTVREVRDDAPWNFGKHRIVLLLNEIDNSHMAGTPGYMVEPGFNVSGFRPLRERKTSIECFRALLNPTEKKVEA